MTTQSDALARLEYHVGQAVRRRRDDERRGAGPRAGLFLVTPDSPATSQLLNAGLLVLMATPMLRVLLSVVEYVRMGDWFFAATTLAVVAELSVAVVSALGWRR